VQDALKSNSQELDKRDAWLLLKVLGAAASGAGKALYLMDLRGYVLFGQKVKLSLPCLYPHFIVSTTCSCRLLKSFLAITRTDDSFLWYILPD
jgi:hypothetical protein